MVLACYVLLLELATTPNRELGPHVNFDVISEIDCKLLFRYNNRDRVVLEMFVFCNCFNHSYVLFLLISCTVHRFDNYQDITYVEMARVPQPWRLY